MTISTLANPCRGRHELFILFIILSHICPYIIPNLYVKRLFNWCSGYHVCLTRRRSQVRSLDWTYFYNYNIQIFLINWSVSQSKASETPLPSNAEHICKRQLWSFISCKLYCFEICSSFIAPLRSCLFAKTRIGISLRF